MVKDKKLSKRSKVNKVNKALLVYEMRFIVKESLIIKYKSSFNG